MTTKLYNRDYILIKYNDILSELDEDFNSIDFEDFRYYVIKMLDYNVLNGKMFRCFYLIETVEILNKFNVNEIESESIIDKAIILGWVLEFIQATSIVIDDIMDQSVTRRGKECWFRNVCIQAQRKNHQFIFNFDMLIKL